MDPYHPELWRLGDVANVIRNGGLGVVPTDTVYAFVCDIDNKNAIERLYRLKKMDPKKPLSMMCRNIADVAQWTRGFPQQTFRAARRCLPGAYTFILRGSRATPRIIMNKKRREVGVRVPDDAICQAVLEELQRPLLCSSVVIEDDETWHDPAAIADMYGDRIDFVVDAGHRAISPSTIIDLTSEEPVLIRHGKGDPDLFE